MNKCLFLIRHTHADIGSGQSDHLRSLTSKGRSDAFELGKLLKEKGIAIPHIIYSSTAERAKTTTEIASKQWGYEYDNIIWDENLYNISVSGLFRFVNGLDDENHSVAIVGHNPTVTYLAEYLTNEALSFQPGTCAFIEFGFASWKEITQHSGALRELIEVF